jgi:DNA-binding transcriptional LysR family regulator
MFDLNDMLFFARVAEMGSFSAAARDLNMPKSTLSRRISQLETHLGCRLLHRTTRSLQLTELGTIFYQHCIRVAAEAKEAERMLALSQETPRGLLRVAAPAEFGTVRLGELAAKYLHQYSEVRLELYLSNRFVDIVEEGFDLALRAGRLKDSSLIARRLKDSRMVVCAAPCYLETHGEPHIPEDLHKHICLTYSNSDGRTTLHFSAANQLRKIPLEGKLVSNSMEALQDAAIAGLGIAILPWLMCQDTLKQGALQPILEDWQLPMSGIYVVYPSPRHLTPKVRSFIDFIADQL